MPIALVQNKQHAANAATVSQAFDSNNTAGNFLVVGVEANYTVLPTLAVNDTLNGAYTPACSLVSTDGQHSYQIFFLPNCAAGANTVTASVTSGTSSYKNLMIAEFSGVKTVSPEDGVGSSATGSGTSITTGNYTVTVGDLIIGLAGTNLAGIAAGNGTSLGTDTYSMTEYSLAASTTANPSFTASSGGWNAVGVAFKAAAVPAPSPASITPTSDVQGLTGNVTVSGTNFDSGGTATLSFSGSGITVNSYGTRNATTLTANITVGISAAATARDVIVTNADTQTGTLSAAFTVLLGNFNVSGSVGIAAAGATVSYTGTSSGSAVADASGNFTLSLANGTYTITPTLAGFTFYPASQVVVVNNAAVTGVNFSLPYSQPDCRNYGNFPNLAVNVQGTLTYTTPKTDSRAAGAPVDSRAAGAPVDSRVSKTLNSRTPGTFGPDE